MFFPHTQPPSMIEMGGQRVQLYNTAAISCSGVCFSLSAFEVGNVLLVETQSLDGNYLALSDSHNFMPPGGHYRSLYI